MTDHSSSLAWQGDGDDNLTPGQFLREIDNKIEDRNYNNDSKMIKCLRNNIAYGSAADDWFNSLDAANKDTYDHLTAAFELQWPLIPAPKASKTERIQTLKEWVLKAEDLGKKVEGPGGSQIWSHVKWATGLGSRVRDAEDQTGFLIGEVYNALPRPVRELIRSKPRTTYEELSAAVLALDTSDLKEAAADYSRNEETARLAREPPSPTKAIREALTSTHLRDIPHQYNPSAPATYNLAPRGPAQMNPFQGAGGRGSLNFSLARGTNITPFRGSGPGALGMGRGNRPQQNLRDRPIDQRHADLVRHVLPHHPNTAEGHAAYQAQVSAWHTANPVDEPNEQHPYPLTPGMPPVGSRECWLCGKPGHMQGAPVCEGSTLPEPERKWHRVTGFITREFNKARFTNSQPVNYVGYTQYNTYPDYNHRSYSGGAYVEDVDEGQGNGGGLPA
jgi:hypothetical protein